MGPWDPIDALSGEGCRGNLNSVIKNRTRKKGVGGVDSCSLHAPWADGVVFDQNVEEEGRYEGRRQIDWFLAVRN